MSEKKSGVVEDIQKLCDALEAGEYNAPPPSLHVLQPSDAFWKTLTPEASEVIKKSTKGPWDPSKMRSFLGVAQWPIKGWYETATARALNKLVGLGLVEEVVGVVKLQLATGGFVTDLKMIDNGPDEYGLMGFIFISGTKNAELNKILGGEFCFREGEIPPHAWPQWRSLSGGETLASRLVKQVG